MRQAVVCSQCGKTVPADAPQGLCPGCVIKLGPGSDVAEQRRIPPGAPIATEGLTLPPQMPRAGEETIALPMAEFATEPMSAESVETFADTPGYQVLGELGRGGMGVVYKAKQIKLGRLVALKMILAGSHAGEADLARFRTEAEAIARVKHANIVQIYEIGEHEGKPYFALEFCPGGSLAQKIDGTPMKPLEAARIVEILADGMEAAHREDIIHRDLKPANVLLLKDGTPKITDFGLAKKLDDAGQTQSGAVMGTPSYMAPEQAGGESKKMGPKADIYALGAILYELLTGRPPFKAATPLDTIMQVVLEEPVPPSQLQHKTPRDLETICLKCLEKDPAKRYTSAEALAEDLRRYQKGEPIHARPVGNLERAMKWIKRYPARAGLVAALAVGLLVGTAGIIWYQNEQAKLNLMEAVRQVEAERKQAKLDAEEAARKSEAERKNALAEQAIRASLDQADKARAVLQSLLKKPGGVFELLNRPDNWQNQIELARAALDRAVALKAGANLDPALDEQASELHRRLAQDDADRLLALRLEKIRLDKATWVEGKFNNRQAAEEYPKAFAPFSILYDDPAAAATLLQSSPIKEQLVAALDDWAVVAFQFDKMKLTEQLLAVARLAAPDPDWGDRLRQLKVWRDPPALAQLVAQAPPGLSPQMLTVVGSRLEEDTAIRESWLRLAQTQHPADFWLNYGLANALARTDPVEAAGYFRVALALRPGSTAAYNNLGRALMMQKKPAEASTAYRKAIELDQKFAWAYNGLGVALRAQKKLPEAIAAYHKAIEIEPKDANAYGSLGSVLHHQQKLPEAIAAYHKAIELEPKLAIAYNNLGLVLRDQKKLPEAIAAYYKAIELEPKLAMAYVNLGVALVDQKKLSEAIAAYHKAIELEPKLAIAYYNLGNALYIQKQLPETIAAFHKAIELDPKDAQAYGNLGTALVAQKKLPEAIAAFHKAIELDPKYAIAYYSLGTVLQLHDQRRLPEAIAAFHKAIEINPNHAEAHCNLGHALRRQGRFTEALREIRVGHELGSARPGWSYSSAQWVKQCEELIALDERLTSILAGKAKAMGGAENLALAKFCQQYKQRHATAVGFYQDAFKSQPALAEDLTKQHRYNAACAAALAGCGHGDEAAKLRDEEKSKWRGQARDWLQSDLDSYDKELNAGKLGVAMSVTQRLSHWQQDGDLAGVRDAKELNKLSDEEKQAWRKLWADVRQLHKDAQSRFVETRLDGTLSAKEGRKIHEFKMTAGKSYVIDLESIVFDAFLELEGAGGNLLAENDDISPTNLNSRIVFAPKKDGTYRIAATSFQQRGVGAYTLTIREFTGGDKSK